jgi:hypothetical protein
VSSATPASISGIAKKPVNGSELPLPVAATWSAG